VNLGTRIRLALGVAGLVPVLVLGWAAVDTARRELAATVGGALERQAGELARSCERYTLDGLRGLRQTATYIPFASLSRAEISAALAIPYRQSPDLQILALLERDGRPAADVVSDPAPERDPGLAGHEPVNAQALAAFAAQVPLRAALDAGLAVGPPYRSAAGVPRLVLAVRFDGAAQRVLAAELSLAELARRLHEAAGDGGVAYLADRDGNLLASTAAGGLSAEERALLAGGRPASRLVAREDGGRWLAAFAPVGALGWSVVIGRPEAHALRAAEHVQRLTVGWAIGAALLSGLLGVFLSRALTRPVRRLTEAAAALRDGRSDVALPPAGADELGTLADTFAHMVGEVRRRDAEIRAFNADLQARVEVRTAELKAAQGQIARSQRLTALGSLSAGVAQGLNDPMTAVVGLVTLARDEAGPGSPPGKLLGSALVEARRVTGVIRDLRRLASPGLASGARRFELDRPVQAAVERFRSAAAEQGVELRAEPAKGLPPMEGDPEQLESLVARLLENALEATPRGGHVTVSTSTVDGAALRLVVADDGRGIPAADLERIFDPFYGSSEVGGTGIGLTLVHGIVQAHHGSIQLESAVGRGTTFTLHFPAASPPPA